MGHHGVLMSIRRAMGILILAAFAAMLVYGLMFQRVHVQTVAGAPEGRELKGSALVTEAVRQMIVRSDDGQIIAATNAGGPSAPECPT